MKVLLVDDNRLMLEGLQNLLEVRNVEVSGTASNGTEAVAMARNLRPDVILMDIRMPGCDGLAATRLIKAEMPEMKIVILTTSTEDQDLFEAVKSGACGYLHKSLKAQELIEALEQARQGVPPFSPGLATKLLNEFARVSNAAAASDPANAAEAEKKTTWEGFNARQKEVLKLVADGLSYKEVGARLDLSPSAIRYHMAEIMNKLHLENRAQVLAYAGRLRLGDDKPPE